MIPKLTRSKGVIRISTLQSRQKYKILAGRKTLLINHVSVYFTQVLQNAFNFGYFNTKVQEAYNMSLRRLLGIHNLKVNLVIIGLTLTIGLLFQLKGKS